MPPTYKDVQYGNTHETNADNSIHSKKGGIDFGQVVWFYKGMFVDKQAGNNAYANDIYDT
jgi:hypothetical protein